MISWIPEGWHSITPRLVTHDQGSLIEFLRRAFGAIGDLHTERPSEIRIGDSMVMVSGAIGAREAHRAFLYLYVEDTDATYSRAIAAGASAIEAPCNTPYGDRRATIRDPAGNVWQVATRLASR